MVFYLNIFLQDDSGIDIPTSRLPDTPNNQSYRLMKFAEKNMKKLGRNFTKSFTRMRKHISKTDSDTTGEKFKQWVYSL